MIDDTLNRQFIWIEPNLANAIKNHIQKSGIDVSSMEPEDIHNLVETVHAPTKKEKKRNVLDSIKRILVKTAHAPTKKEKKNVFDRIKRMFVTIEKKEIIDIEQILAMIENDPVFKSHIK